MGHHPQLSEKLKNVAIPRMVRVKQIFPRPQIDPSEIPGVVRGLLSDELYTSRVKPGMRIAITVGSRGIANIHIITKAIVDFCKERGALPFIVPAMGSHGGATAEGQRKIVEHYGCTEEFLGCPIRSSMEVVKIGVNEEGKDVFIDRNAAEADGIIINCRIKPHSSFRGKYESGIMKMMAIGLGKQAGAEQVHREGMGQIAKNVPMYGKCILANAPVLFAVACIENAFDETAKLVAVPAARVQAEEPALLREAFSYMPRILVDHADVLIVDEIGKNYSGDGMDPNVTGNFPTPYATGGLPSQRVVTLSLSKESLGNAIGVGNCSAAPRRIFNDLDYDSMYMNALTCTIFQSSMLPLILDTDKECIQMCLKTCVGNDPENPLVVRIPNSLHIEHIMLSEAYLPEIEANPDLVLESEPFELVFDEDGNLPMKDGKIVF